jgi:hypothetical protein
MDNHLVVRYLESYGGYRSAPWRPPAQRVRWRRQESTDECDPHGAAGDVPAPGRVRAVRRERPSAPSVRGRSVLVGRRRDGAFEVPDAVVQGLQGACDVVQLGGQLLELGAGRAA